MTKQAAEIHDKLGSPKNEQLPKTVMGKKSDEIAAMLDMYKLQIAQVIPRHITPERLIQVCATMVTRNQELMVCTPASLVGALMQSAILGLDPSLGQCAFIPRYNSKLGKKECNFQIQYQGILHLARKSGEIKTVYSECVREGDVFEYELGLEPKLIHKPNVDSVGELKYVYVVWRFKDDGFFFRVLNKTQVMARKAVSKTTDIWTKWPEEQWRKTAINASKNYIPMGVEMQTALTSDEQVLPIDAFSKDGLDLTQLPEPEPEALPSEKKVEEPPKKRTRKAKEKPVDVPVETDVPPEAAVDASLTDDGIQMTNTDYKKEEDDPGALTDEEIKEIRGEAYKRLAINVPGRVELSKAFIEISGVNTTGQIDTAEKVIEFATGVDKYLKGK